MKTIIKLFLGFFLFALISVNVNLSLKIYPEQSLSLFSIISFTKAHGEDTGPSCYQTEYHSIDHWRVVKEIIENKLKLCSG
jgi:hypothetical protein